MGVRTSRAVLNTERFQEIDDAICESGSNAQLVERVVHVAKELDREGATPAQAREILEF